MKNLRCTPSLKAALAVMGAIFWLGACSWAQQNLLANPGLETGDFTGWTVTQNTINYGVNTNEFVITGTDPSLGSITVIVHSGNYAGYSVVCDVWCGGQPYGMYIELSQTVNLTPGQIYTAGFWVGNGSAYTIGNGSEILVNGQPIFPNNYPYQLSPNQYGFVTADFLATQASTTVSFVLNGSGDARAGFSMDDMSLVLDALTPGDGNYAYLLQQNSNTVSAYQVNVARGLLLPGAGSPIPTGSSPVALAASGNLTYVADHGSSQISAYLTNFTSGRMIPVAGSPYRAGIVPSAIAIDAALHFVYVTGLDSDGHGAISGWRYVPAFGGLVPIAGSPFPAGTTPGAIAFDRSGQHAYVVDTAENELLAYSVNPTTGALAPLSGSPYRTGVSPSAVAVDTIGNYVYVATSGDQHISGFKIASSGALTPVTGSPFPTGVTPVSMTFDGTQRFLYVLNSGSSNIWGYQVNQNTGTLTVVTNSPFQTGTSPQTVSASAAGYVYVNTSSGISSFQINTTAGTLTQINDSPLPFFGTAIATNNSGAGAP